MAYDSPLTALEDIGRILAHIAEVVPSASGLVPMVAQFNSHLADMRTAAVAGARQTEHLPQPAPAPAPPAPEPPPPAPPDPSTLGDPLGEGPGPLTEERGSPQPAPEPAPAPEPPPQP